MTTGQSKHAEAVCEELTEDDNPDDDNWLEQLRWHLNAGQKNKAALSEDDLPRLDIARGN